MTQAKPNTEPKDSYLNRCIGCSKVKTSSPDKICASCSNKGFTTPIDTDPLEELIDDVVPVHLQDRMKSLIRAREQRAHTEAISEAITMCYQHDNTLDLADALMRKCL